jgi:hypothetical protein
LVSTIVPLIVLESTMLPVAAAGLLDPAAAAGVLLWAAGLLELELELELAQAARASTAAASPAALHILRMSGLFFLSS